MDDDVLPPLEKLDQLITNVREVMLFSAGVVCCAKLQLPARVSDRRVAADRRCKRWAGSKGESAKGCVRRNHPVAEGSLATPSVCVLPHAQHCLPCSFLFAVPSLASWLH